MILPLLASLLAMLWLAVAAAAEQATVDAHGEVSDAFDAALRLNAAEHDAQVAEVRFYGAAMPSPLPPPWPPSSPPSGPLLPVWVPDYVALEQERLSCSSRAAMPSELPAHSRLRSVRITSSNGTLLSMCACSFRRHPASPLHRRRS